MGSITENPVNRMARPQSPEQLADLISLMRATLSYDPETGIFVRLIGGHGNRVGDIAGSIYPRGYRYITLAYKDYPAAHLAWLWMTGKWPEAEIDHRDRIKSNNAWSNLRSATRSQNLTNRRVMSNNMLGIKGVYYKRGKYQAAVYVNRKTVLLGTYDNAEDAAFAVRAGGLKYHGEFYHAD